MPSKQLPASIRSLKAQLRILQRPSVWVSAAVLLGAIVLLQETWKHPERFATPNEPSVNGFPASDAGDTESPVRPAPLDPPSSVEEPTFGSNQGTEESPSSLSSGLTDPNGADRLTSPLLLPSRPSTARSSSSPSVPDPFASIRTNSNASGSSSSGSNTETGTSRSLNGGLTNNPQNPFAAGNSSDEQPDNAFGSNPLESAIDRYASPTQSQSNPSAQASPSSSDPNATNTPESSTSQTSPTLSAPTSAMGQPGFVQPQPIPGQPSYGQTQPQPQFLPQTSPAPGTTGYTMPPAFRTNDNTSAGRSFGNYNNYSNGSSGVPSTVSPSTTQPGTANPTIQPQAAPFSIPRAVPGQSIGGGQINTFSNP